MTEYTADEMLKYAEQRNRGLGRRTDYLEWVKVFQLPGGPAAYSGAEVTFEGVAVECLGEGGIIFNRAAGLEAPGIRILGPVVIEGRPIEVIYDKPLAFAVNPADPSIMWVARVAGIVAAQPGGLVVPPPPLGERHGAPAQQDPSRPASGRPAGQPEVPDDRRPAP